MPKKSSDDVLMDYVNKKDGVVESQPVITDEFRAGRHKVDHISSKNEKDFIELPTSDMPMSMFYPGGTHVVIRPALVSEIQSYSIIDNNNPYDVSTKMNELLSTCARVRYIDGTFGTYRDIFEGDKIYVITQISRYTMQNRKILSLPATDINGHPVDMELVPANFDYWVILDEIAEFFNDITKKFEFPLINDEIVVLGPPTIGQLQDLHTYILTKTLKQIPPNVAFMKCMTWSLGDKKEYSFAECELKELEFKKMDVDVFDFVNDTVDKMTFGIKDLVKKCTLCGVEVRTPFTFPGGPSALFVKPDAFHRLLKK